jgi:hypothetical protein
MDPMLMLFMEDFDNAELPEHERRDQLEVAVEDYNDTYDTNYNPTIMVREYERFKKDKYNDH